jgi:hypothetical protein
MNKANSKEKKTIFKLFKEKYGLEKEVFKKQSLYIGTKNRVYLGPKNILPIPRTSNNGILILRDNFLKPTTNFFQIFGNKITESFLEITKEQAIAYMKGDDLEIESELDGYILIKYKDYPLGCGFIRENKIKNQIPKSKRLEIHYI